MALSLVNGGLPPRMTYGQWLAAHPESMPHPCLNCGHEMLAKTCDRDPIGEAYVWCPVCDRGYDSSRKEYDEETGAPVDWKSRGVY
jgi:uncharacterized Zn finger protein (UPF0148 family)